MIRNRFRHTFVLICLWIGTAYPQTDFTQSEYHSIDLTSAGITGAVQRVVLSPDSKYAAVETRWKEERHLYVIDLESKRSIPVDPREELDGYEGWKRSPISELYPVSDAEPQWYPGTHAGQQWLLFKSNGIDNQSDLFLFRPSTGSYVRVTESEDEQYNAKWSHDGEYLSFLSGKENAELYVVPNMGRVFNEVEKLQMAYNHIPSLADVYSAAIFDRSQDLFFSTPELILDYDWLGDGSIALLQASRKDSASARLYYLRSSGKAKFVADVPQARYVKGGRYFTAASVLTPVRTESRTIWTVTVYNEEDFESSIQPNNGKGISFERDETTTAPLICGRNKFVVAFAGSYNDELDFRVYTKGRARDRRIDIPANGTIIDLDMRNGEGANRYTVAGVALHNRRYTLFTFRFEYQIDENDVPLMEKKRFIEVGALGHFCRYTGDVVPGDFLPGGGIWGELRFTDGLADFSAGMRLAYVPLTGSLDKQEISFAAYFWSIEAYLKYTYPLSYEFQPYAAFGVGVAASNSRQIGDEPRKRQVPFYFDFSGGAAFTLNPRLNMHVLASFVKLSDDIDRLNEKSIKSDSYILVGIGFSYTLSF